MSELHQIFARKGNISKVWGQYYLSQKLVRYVHSEATYLLSMSELHEQIGKRNETCDCYYRLISEDKQTRVSDQLSAAMYNQTLPHGDKAIAETWEYHRNVVYTQVSWHSKNGTQQSFPVCTKGNASDCLVILKIRQVTCTSRHHFLFLPWSSFQQNSCTIRKA